MELAVVTHTYATYSVWATTAFHRALIILKKLLLDEKKSHWAKHEYGIAQIFLRVCLPEITLSLPFLIKGLQVSTLIVYTLSL